MGAAIRRRPAGEGAASNKGGADGAAGLGGHQVKIARGGVDGTAGGGGGRRGCLPREFRSGKARGLLAKEDRLTSVLVRRGGGQSENEPQRVDVFL
jgi:hypothetical protein